MNPKDAVDLFAFAIEFALAAGGGALGSYVAIRVQLAHQGAKLEALTERIGGLQSAIDRAHERIDSIPGRIWERA